MKLGLVISGAVLAGGLLGLVAAAPWQDAKAKDKPAGEGAMPFTPEEMAAWQKAMTPGKEHQDMATCAGAWNVKGQMWMKPDLPPQDSTGTSNIRSVLGGRYLVEEYSGNSSMGAYNGMGILAFNNTTGQYEHVWFDDMSTGLMVSKGTSSGGVTTLQGECACPIAKGNVKVRMESKKINDNERELTMYSTEPGKPEFKNMVLHYTRSGAAPTKAGSR